MRSKNQQPRGELDGFLDGGSRLTGDLHFKDTFRVDGRLEGSIHSEGNLVIGESGEIEGEIHVARVFVAGVLRGTVRGAQRVEIGATGKIYGNIETQTLVVEDGATFEGNSSMDRESTHHLARGQVAKLLLEPEEDSPSASGMSK